MSSEQPTCDPIGLSGRVIGDYQVLRWLGSGGMADVYLAQQQSLKRPIALKVLKSEYSDDAQYVRRFQNEAQAAAALVHPNIVQIFEVGRAEGFQFIAQEYVRGQNLKELLDRQASLDTPKTVAILRQVAAAICKAEEHGIVHRDIKPENILLGTDGRVKVADFGLARRSTNEEGTKLTQIGVTMGTPMYMSPEQVEGRIELDGRTDVYSLGVTAYQMLAGYPPFNGDSPLSIALQHVNRSPPPLDAIRDDVPAELLQLIHRWLAKNPEERCRNASEVRDDLERLPIAGGREHADTQSLVGIAVEGQPGLTAEFAVTRELDTVLRRDRKPLHRWLRRTGAWWPVAVALLLGATLAFAMGRNDPLAGAVAARENAVPRKESLQSQYFYASLVDSQAAWQSVIDYLPLDDPGLSEANRLMVLRAKKQLARWYIKNDRPADALPLLEELAALDDLQNGLRATGFAWQAIAYQRLGDLDKAADVLTSANQLSQFLDQPILDELEQLEAELRARLD